MTDDILNDVSELARWLLQDQHRESGEALAIAARFIAELAVHRCRTRAEARHVIDTVSNQMYGAVDDVLAARQERVAATDTNL